jgi:hypothetical protein
MTKKGKRSDKKRKERPRTKSKIDWNDPVQVAKFRKQYAKEHEKELKEYRTKYWSSSEVRTRLRKQYAELDPKKKEKLRKQKREYGSSTKGLAVRRNRYHRTIDARHAERKRKYEKVKHEVFSGLSAGEPKCAHCKETEFLFLTIDHRDGRKTAKEKRGIMKSEELYITIRREFNKTGKWSDRYQVLCYTCNMLKERKLWRYIRSMTPGSILTRKSRDKLKREVFSHYSNGEPKCACCEWDEDMDGLSIDHKHGRKNTKHPKGMSSGPLYRHIKKEGYPAEYRVLCLNCNAASGHHGKCPHEEHA